MRCAYVVVAVAAAAAAACSDPALPTASSLACPVPGALPFRLSSSGFQSGPSKNIASDNPRFKDEASDTLGNPGGAMASVYIEDNQRPSAGPLDYRGTKARNPADNGFGGKPLASEVVSLWYYDADRKAWQSPGRVTTDSLGGYDLPATGFVAPSGRPVYAVLEADGSCAEHFDFLYPAGTKLIVSDIDGTLTADDNELLMQLSSATYVPRMMGAADRLIQAWGGKGYPIVYLTARPNAYRAESRGWLEDLGFPTGALITQTSSVTADAYKTVWLDRMIQDFGWNIVAAYGNADTDITAYENAGIAKDHTFIVGPLAGNRGTVKIENNDFSAHIAGFVAAQPANP
jgi:hypothetical protein